MLWTPLPRCGCPCHQASVLPWAAPVLTDPVEALAACDLCASAHRGVWTLWKRPRITKRWFDSQADGEK